MALIYHPEIAFLGIYLREMTMYIPENQYTNLSMIVPNWK